MSALITFLVGVLLLVSWERLKHVRSLYRLPALRDEAFGLSELSLPNGWRAAKGLNEQAGLQAIEPLRARYVIVISEFKSDFANLLLAEHASDTRQRLTSSKRLLAVRGPWRRVVGTHEALQYELEVAHKNLRITYLHTTVDGQRGVHQIVGWATSSRYSRAAFDRILDGFREVPDTRPSDPGESGEYRPTIHPQSAFKAH